MVKCYIPSIQLLSALSSKILRICTIIVSRKFDTILFSNGTAFAGCYTIIQPITSARTDKIHNIGNPAARVLRKSFTSKHLGLVY